MNCKTVLARVSLTSLALISFVLPACRQSNAPPANDTTSPPQGISINTTLSQMVGQKAPNVQLNDSNGKPVSLSDYAGKPVLMVFWTTTSPDCQKEMPVIQQIYDVWQSKGLAILAVDILNSRPDETAETVTLFLKSNNFSFPVLLDAKQIATIQYHVATTPTNFFIDKGGVIREVAPGPLLNQSAVETSLSRIISP
jgi:cytochrome c biogenesis protein CcmG, thiol:disulfide interchange protein DsbE